MARMRNLTAGSKVGVMLSSSTPRPSRSGTYQRVARHLAANADLDLVRVAGVHDLLEHAQNHGVRRVVEVGDPVVAAVDGEQVLDEVVRADAEKVALAGQQVAGERRAGDLDHCADAELRVEGLLAFRQLGLGLGEQRVGAVELLPGR